MQANNATTFAPQLFIESGVIDTSFYEKAFGAIELRRFTNNDGSVHIAELSIDGMLFHLHEEKEHAGQFSPKKINGTTTLIGLFVRDVDAVINKAIEAGAKLVSPAQSYDYGYRQGNIQDPFGHVWLIEARL